MIELIRPCLSFSQAPYVPLNHWAYAFLERMETKQIIAGLLNHSKPLSRAEFAGYLKLISEKTYGKDNLNRVEQQQLHYLIFEFKEEFEKISAVKIPYRSAICQFKQNRNVKKFFPTVLYQNNRNFLSWHHDEIRFYLDPVYRYQRRSYQTDSSGQTKTHHFFTNGFFAWGYLTDFVGILVNVRDNKEWGDQQYQLGNYTLPGLGFVRATSTDFIYHDETEAYLKFGLKNFQFIYGKFSNYWGAGNSGSLILSHNATSYDQIKFEYHHQRFQFTSLYAFLIDYRYHVLDSLQEKKYLAAHRLEFLPWRWLALGISEMVVFKGRSFEPAYLNPVMFFRSAEHYLGSPDNMMMAADFKFTRIKNIKLYGELLIDDIVTGKLGSDWYANKYGFLGGIFITQPFYLENVDVRVEYVRIRPYVYTHENSLQYTHYATSLGHWIGPNSDLLSLLMSYQATLRLRLRTCFLFWRHGANTSGENFGGDVNEPVESAGAYYPKFLGGDLEKKQSLSFSFRYELIRQLFFDFKIESAALEKANQKHAEFSWLGSVGINF